MELRARNYISLTNRVTVYSRMFVRAESRRKNYARVRIVVSTLSSRVSDATGREMRICAGKREKDTTRTGGVHSACVHARRV